MVISRRVLLGTGAAVVGVAALVGVGAATHRLDDVADAAGLEPKPQPDPGDDRLVLAAADDLAALLAMTELTAARHDALALAPFEVVVREQLAAVGGATATLDAEAPDDPATAVSELRRAFRDASRNRVQDARAATSPALVRVMASMSAGLAQCAREIGELR